MLSGHHRATVASCALGPVRRRQLVGQATCAPISLSLLQLAVQLRFGASGAFKLDVDLVALERERVPIYFAMPEIRRSTANVWSSSQLPLTASTP